VRRAVLLILLAATNLTAAPRHQFQLIKAESAIGAAGYKPRPIEVSVWYPAASGRDPWPVVLWSARSELNVPQSRLAEYLASHGYAVVFVRPQQADELNAQVEDMRGGLRAARELRGVDQSRTAIIASSDAREAATRLQRTDETVRGVMSITNNTSRRRTLRTLAAFFKGGAPVSSPAQIELTASDKVRVTADAYRATKPRGCILMVHQSGSSRGEFRTIAPALVKMGFTVLAIDGRWGRRDYWNAVWNETARRYGTIEVMDRKDTEAMKKIVSTNDILAGADWLTANGCRSIVVWGSSIHANAVLQLAASGSDRVSAVVAFSPGDYRGRYAEGEMHAIAERVRVPTFIAIAADEEDVASPVFTGVAPERLTLYRSTGRHGSAILFEDPLAWTAVKEFLASISSQKPPA
jgi:dienelactone hydrolase